MSNHTAPCPTPAARFRRVGSLWMCHCGQMFRLGLVSGPVETIKTWLAFSPRQVDR